MDLCIVREHVQYCNGGLFLTHVIHKGRERQSVAVRTPRGEAVVFALPPQNKFIFRNIFKLKEVVIQTIAVVADLIPVFTSM